MEQTQSYRRHALAETLAPHASTAGRGPSTKLSISLPEELVELVRGAASDRGVSFSAMVAAAIRLALDEVEQVRLDAAIDAQNAENLQWAQAYLPIAPKIRPDLEW
jgi:hypothetical protein